MSPSLEPRGTEGISQTHGSFVVPGSARPWPSSVPRERVQSLQLTLKMHTHAQSWRKERCPQPASPVLSRHSHISIMTQILHLCVMQSGTGGAEKLHVLIRGEAWSQPTGRRLKRWSPASQPLENMPFLMSLSTALSLEWLSPQ